MKKTALIFLELELSNQPNVECGLLVEVFCPLFKSGRVCAVRSYGDQLRTAPSGHHVPKLISNHKIFCPVVSNNLTNFFLYLHSLPNLTLQ